MRHPTGICLAREAHMSSESLVQARNMRNRFAKSAHAISVAHQLSEPRILPKCYAGSCLEIHNSILFVVGSLGRSEDSCVRKIGFALHYGDA